ncbi:MAG: phage holin family protein [Candidatus Obscuribacter phosphatis]|uniref:Phage holin family protein n=1 Tax=Candidatus Obscuribacter phosphatis TaxID=1906157 RepID=A0A8J7PFM4_9BACT|nr:phage holin family protein [Candidatus Obscuribacter phosphatis]
MVRSIIRLLLTASAFYFLLPMLPGVEFHGNFMHALAAGILFAFFGWLVEFLAIAISAMLTIGTWGMALLILVPAWLFGFWLLPAVTLKVLAGVMPATLSITGWLPAIGGGLIMMIIGVATSGDTHKKMRRDIKIIRQS